MSELALRIAALSPEKRDLLLRQLRQAQPPPQPESRPAAAPAPQALEPGAPFPLSGIQQVYWISRRGLYDLGGCGTNTYFELHFPDAGDGFVERLERALGRLIARHPMLRMVVLPDGRQRVLDQPPPYRVEVRDLRDRSADEAATAMETLRERLRYTVADLERWPLFDVAVHLLEDRQLRLHLRFEPLILDGGSRTLLFDEIFRLLDQPDLELPPLTFTYRDYVLATAARAARGRLAEAREYWLARLPNLPPAPELPAAVEVGPATPARLRNHFVRALEPEEWTRLRALSLRERLTPSATVFAVFAEMISLWSRSPRFTVNAEGTYRPPVYPGIEGIVGNFNTMLLLGIDSLEGDFRARASRLQEQSRDALDHRELAGEDVLRELNRSRTRSSRLSTPVIFNSLIEYNRGHDPAFRESRVKLGVLYADAGLYAPHIQLLFSVDQFPDGSLDARSQAAEGTFPPGVVETMMAAFSRRLRWLVEDAASWSWTWAETARRLVPPEQLARRAGQPSRVLNEAGEPCPDWTVGEVHAAEGGRLVATGEAGRTLPSGEVEVLGREGESLVRIAGYPVALGAVERRLEGHPAVRRAAVAAVPWDGGHRLVAWAAAPAGRAGELRAFLAEASPAYYLVPDLVVCAPELPAGGRARLAILGRALLEEARAGAPPVDGGLRRLWEELLGRRPIGDGESFFDLGGDSFLLARLMDEVAGRFGAGAPLVEFFLEPTLAGLSRLLRSRRADPSLS